MGEYFYGITDKGKCRTKNEDTFFVRETINRQFIIACVIDGVGGYKGGDVAAAIARSVIRKHVENLSGNVIETLQRAIVAANAKINEEKIAANKNERMACVLTCAVADIKNNKFWYAHVGDTRVYLLRDHSLIKISKDHSAVGFLEESGRLSEEEAMRHPRRNEINKALGFEQDITTAGDFIETGESPFLSGDVLLLCSDGLTDMISSGTIISVMTTTKSLASKAKALVDAANTAGGNDNITAVLIENNNQPKIKLAPVPVQRKKDTIISPGEINEELPLMVSDSSKKNRGSRIALLVLLILGLLVMVVAISFKINSEPTAKYTLPIEYKKKKTEQLVLLNSAVADSTKIFAFPLKNSSLQLTDSIMIRKDSFYLKGNGATIIADSGYRGPAFVIHSTAKHIILDSLVIENFETGIVVEKNNVTFKNIRFINCRVPVQYRLSFPDSIVNGQFSNSIFITPSNHP